MFVNEYRNLLADRLLQSLNYDISREVHVHGSGLGPILQDSLGMGHFVMWVILGSYV